MTTRTVCFGSYCFALPGGHGEVIQYDKSDVLFTLGMLALAAVGAAGLFMLGYHYSPAFPDTWESLMVQMSYFLSH